ncbi:MAG: ATP-binding protein, partial [Pseudomonadota bacterium]
EEIINLSVMDIHPKEDLPYAIERFDKQWRQEITLANDIPVLRKDGTIFYADISTSLVSLTGKSYMQGIFRDVTERKQAEESLRESREKFHSMVDNIGMGVALISPTMEILELNHQMRVWFPDIDPSMRPICYRAFNNPPRDEICDYCPTYRTLQDGKVHDATTVKPMAGGPRNYRIVSSPIFNTEGRVTAAIEMVDDITERLSLEAQLRQSQKLESIGTLAGGIAHDFNNILSSILGFTELALDDVAKDSIIEDHLQEVYTAGKRAKDLIMHILAFARQSEEKLKPVRVDTIAEEVLHFIRSSIPTMIEIKKSIDSNSIIMGNITQVHQILMNLCTNAAHAMEDRGGIMEVGLADVEMDERSSLIPWGLKPGNYIKMTVSDTGSGIDPSIIDSIFEPYFTTKGVGEGTGMGLALVHGIVESYGGRITVDSKLGKGTTFSIYFPITKKREDYRPYEEEKLPSGIERILFVDDELPIAKMGSQLLERLGYQVTVRTSSVETLELFRSRPNDFDLVITDMAMPNMTGDKLAVELMKIRSDIPVILCTGYSKNISDDSVTAIGIKAFAYKPVVKTDLAKTVRKVLDEAKKSDS